MTLPICEKLTARTVGRETVSGPRLINPDGPEAAALIEELVEALNDARAALASLAEDALGMVVVSPCGDDDFGHEYPVRDEMLSKIDATLSRARQ